MKHLIFLILLLPSLLYAQKYDYTWQMGYSTFKNSPRPQYGFKLDFNSQTAKLDTFLRNHNYAETIVSMSDRNGKFLFSTNGCKVFNKNLDVMENGDSLNPSTWNDYVCNAQGGEIISQGALSLPLPDSNDSTFLLLHTQIDDIGNDKIELLPLNLYTTKINMLSNNGLGKVFDKNKLLISDVLDGGNISAVKHDNGKDWWVLVRKFISNTYYSIKVTSKGVDTVFSQSLGNQTNLYGQGGGQTSFSSNGKNYAYYTHLDDLMLYDFDRNSGKLSNFRSIRIPRIPKDGNIFTGLSFSPNSRFIYIFAAYEIFQVDLQESDTTKRVEKIADHDSINAPFAYPIYAQLAPDCRIYFVSVNGIQTFGYIRHPDRKGTNCQVVQGGIKLPFSVATKGGLPNNPNYRLGTTPTYPCDSTIRFAVSTKETTLPQAHYILYPNPTHSILNIDYEADTGELYADITIVDLVGRVLTKEKKEIIATPLSIDVSNLPAGVYNCVFSVKGKLPTAQRFVIMR